MAIFPSSDNFTDSTRVVSGPSARGRSGSSGNPADRARKLAEESLNERQRLVRQGAWDIEQAFGRMLGVDASLAPTTPGGVNSAVGATMAPRPTFFDDFEKSIVDAQRPVLDRQYRDTQGTMATSLARRGMMDSTYGANEAGRLDAAFADEAARIRNNARNQGQQFRQSVEARKGELLDLNSRSADPLLTAARARGEATSIVAPSPSTDIGQAFAGFMGPAAAFRQADMYSPRPRTGNTAPVARGQGSSRIVR